MVMVANGRLFSGIRLFTFLALVLLVTIKAKRPKRISFFSRGHSRARI